MKIQKLEPSRRRQGRWLVFLEDGTIARLTEGETARLGLYAGMELDGAALEELTAAQRRGEVFDRALSLLSQRPMSRKELVDRLTAPPRRRREPGEEGAEQSPEALAREREALRALAEQTADRLGELGLLDDREYAHTVVRHYAAKGYGPRRLRDELYRRGVDREYWDEALAELAADTEDGGGRLDELLRRRLRGAEPTRENLRKASDYLARRGFGWDEISEAVARYRDGYEDGESYE